jgi:hypothetical protein
MQQQKQYVLQDAQLAMDLSKANNGQIMSLMQAISELTGLSLEQVCHSSLSTWCTKAFGSMFLLLFQIQNAKPRSLSKSFGLLDSP